MCVCIGLYYPNNKRLPPAYTQITVSQDDKNKFHIFFKILRSLTHYLSVIRNKIKHFESIKISRKNDKTQQTSISPIMRVMHKKLPYNVMTFPS